MSGVRKPKDDNEKIKARIAIAQGKGTSLEDFIESITGVKPEEEPNFAGSRSSTAPTPEAIAAQNSSDYSKEIF